MRVFLAFVFATVMLVQTPHIAYAVNPDEVLSDPALEARARELSKELRCLVCQNQSIDDSDAQLAKDLRVLVRERLVAGDSDREAINFIVDRYGEYVLLKPRFAIHTLILWISPFILFGIGAVILWVQRSRKQEAVSTLSADEEEALEKLLESESQSSS